MMMINRRRVCGGSKLAYDENSYIQDGLVFQLDGINKGGNTDYWTDLKGGVKFAIVTGFTVQDNGIKLDGAHSSYSDKDCAVKSNVGTIECCVSECTNNGVIMMSGAMDNLCITYGWGYSNFFPSGRNNRWAVGSGPTAIISMNDAVAMRDGIILNTKSNDNWNNTGGMLLLGSRPGGYYTNAKVHAIRMYNRKLTTAEMLQNQKIDNVRFELGLNI